MFEDFADIRFIPRVPVAADFYREIKGGTEFVPIVVNSVTGRAYVRADDGSVVSPSFSGAYADLTGKPTLGTLAAQNGTFSGTSSGTNTGDQTSVSGNAGT